MELSDKSNIDLLFSAFYQKSYFNCFSADQNKRPFDSICALSLAEPIPGINCGLKIEDNYP
jgi:hypothetical protein